MIALSARDQDRVEPTELIEDQAPLSLREAGADHKRPAFRHLLPFAVRCWTGERSIIRSRSRPALADTSPKDFGDAEESQLLWRGIPLWDSGLDDIDLKSYR